MPDCGLDAGVKRADYAAGDGKASDAYNAGMFKMNFFMIRTACAQFKGKKPEDATESAILK